MSCYNDCANNPDSNGVCKVEGASCRCEPKIDMAQCAIGSADPKLCTATCINQNKKEVACVMQNGACACPGETISTCYWNDAINGCTGSCPSSQSGTGGDGGDANTVCRQVEGEKRCDCLPPLPAAPPQAPPVPPILSISQTATGGTLNVCAPGSAKVFVSALGSTTVREVLLGSGSCGIMPYTCTGAGTGTFTATTPTGGSASIGYSCK